MQRQRYMILHDAITALHVLVSDRQSRCCVQTSQGTAHQQQPACRRKRVRQTGFSVKINPTNNLKNQRRL